MYLYIKLIKINNNKLKKKIIYQPAKLLKPFIDNYINEDLNENIMVTIRSVNIK